jgi:hypothetical protein
MNSVLNYIQSPILFNPLPTENDIYYFNFYYVFYTLTIARNFHVVQISFYVVYLFRKVQTCSFSEPINKAGNTYTFYLISK